MQKVLVIFWPPKGNVEHASAKIAQRFSDIECKRVNILDLEKKMLGDYDNWIIGGSTVGAHVWRDVDDSNKWFELFRMLDEIDLTKKTVAFFGLGDQILYPGHFVDHMGILQEEFESRKANIVGKWPVEGYNFRESDGLGTKYFFGLALDEDNQPELTDERIDQWVQMIRKDFR